MTFRRLIKKLIL